MLFSVYCFLFRTNEIKESSTQDFNFAVSLHRTYGCQWSSVRTETLYQNRIETQLSRVCPYKYKVEIVYQFIAAEAT